MASMHASPPATDRTVTILAAVLFLVPALGVPSELVLQDTLKSAVAAGGILLAALLFFWQRRKHATALRWHMVLLLPLVLLLYALGSMVWSHTYLASVEACRWFLLGVLLWLGLNTFTRDNLTRLAWGIHAGVVVASLWAVLQFWFDLQLFPQAAPPASTFANRNFFAEYAVAALPFSALVLAQTRPGRWLPALALSVVCVLLAILMTGTRSALLALLVLLPVLGVALARYRGQWALWQWTRQDRWLAGTVLVLGTVGLGMVPSGSPLVVQEGHGVTALERSFVRTASMAKPEEYTVGSFSIRALMWRSTARMLIDRPWTGVGAGAWEVHIPLYQGTHNSVETDFYAHNEYLHLLGEYGLPVGGLFLAVLLAYTLKSAGAVATPWRATALASLLALLIVSNAGFPWHLAGAGTVFMVCLGLLAQSDTQLQAPAQAPSGLHGITLWQPWGMQTAVVVLAGGLGLAGYITWQAMRAEYKIVHAIHLSNAVLRDPAPNAAALETRKADIVRHLREGIAINPHYRKLTTLAADQMARMGDNAGAAWALQSIADSRPHVPDIWANLALLHSQLHGGTQAQTALSQLQRLQPDTPRTRAMEILVLQRAGRTVEAQALLNAYLAEGRLEYDLLILGYAVGMETKDWALAIRSQELRIAQWPQDAADGYFKLGMLYANPGLADDSRALQSFRLGLAAVPATQKESFLQAIPARLRPKL